MKKIIILFLLCPLMIYSLKAQDEHDTNPYFTFPITSGSFQDTINPVQSRDYWKFTGITGLNVTQIGLWNWAEGGNNNANGRIFANLTLKYKRGKISWDSNLDTEFGLMYVPETKYTWRKSSDRIAFSTKFGYEFSNTWYLTILGGFRSQYTRGYDYKIENGEEQEHYVSNWLSPSYSDLSIGVDWKPNSIFSVYLSPVGGRLTTSTDSLLRSKYGVPEDKSFKIDLGLSFKASVNYTLFKDLKIISTVSLFTPYTSKEQPFGNIDVDWEVAISYQFLKVLNVTLGTSLKYYDQVNITDKKGNTGARVQFREVIGVGVGYTF